MEEPRFGTLVIVLDKARNIPNRKKIGKQDAYAIVRLGHDVQRTPTDKRAGQVPSWNHEIRFKVSSETENILKISLFSDDSKTPDLIGDCAIDLSDLYRKHEFDSWFDLKYKDKPAGEVYAELTFYYEGPPRPKPKVEIPYGVPSRPVSGAAFSTALPGAIHMHNPVRQNSMPAPSQDSHDWPSYDLVGGVSNLTVAPRTQKAPAHTAAGYVASPYQSGFKYVETWDGMRDDGQASTPGPGDIRRKSVSGDSRPDMRQPDRTLSRAPPAIERQQGQLHLHQSNHELQDIRRHSQSELQYRGHSNAVHDNQERHTGHVEYDPSRRGSYVSQYSNIHSLSPVPSYARDGGYISGGQQSDHVDQIHHSETLMHPGHGFRDSSPSPRIISPSPGYASGYRNSPVLEQEEFDFNTHDTHAYAPQGPRAASALSYGAPELSQIHVGRPGVFETTAGRIRTHTQTQSYSQPPTSRYNNAAWSEPSHHKSASYSTAWVPQPSQSYTRPDQLAEHGYQPAQTFAPTPAQYRSQSRPLPCAPAGPPARPAKIPLGLTQEEYDILNGR